MKVNYYRMIVYYRDMVAYYPFIKDAEQVFRLLSKKDVLQIICELKYGGGARYSSLTQIIPNHTTLSQRLKLLTQYGIISKEILHDKPKDPPGYVLTSKGRIILEELICLQYIAIGVEDVEEARLQANLTFHHEEE